jgi:hypothetical protein
MLNPSPGGTDLLRVLRGTFVAVLTKTGGRTPKDFPRAVVQQRRRPFEVKFRRGQNDFGEEDGEDAYSLRPLPMF